MWAHVVLSKQPKHYRWQHSTFNIEWLSPNKHRMLQCVFNSFSDFDVVLFTAFVKRRRRRKRDEVKYEHQPPMMDYTQSWISAVVAPVQWIVLVFNKKRRMNGVQHAFHFKSLCLHSNCIFTRFEHLINFVVSVSHVPLIGIRVRRNNRVLVHCFFSWSA